MMEGVFEFWLGVWLVSVWFVEWGWNVVGEIMLCFVGWVLIWFLKGFGWIFCRGLLYWCLVVWGWLCCVCEEGLYLVLCFGWGYFWFVFCDLLIWRWLFVFVVLVCGGVVCLYYFDWWGFVVVWGCKFYYLCVC